MGKGSKPRPVSKNYGNEFERIFGKRCREHKQINCLDCKFREHLLNDTKDPRTDCPSND